MLLGIGDPWVLLAYLLCIASTLLGVGIGVPAMPQLAVRYMTVKTGKELHRAVPVGGVNNPWAFSGSRDGHRPRERERRARMKTSVLRCALLILAVVLAADPAWAAKAKKEKKAKEAAKEAPAALRYGADLRLREEAFDNIPIIADPPGVTRGGENNYFRIRPRIWMEADPMDHVTLRARIVNESASGRPRRAWRASPSARATSSRMSGCSTTCTSTLTACWTTNWTCASAART